MPDSRSLLLAFAGSDNKMRRQVRYWAATMALYGLCTVILWYEVWVGDAQIQPAIWLTACIAGGGLFFYAMVRGSRYLKLSSAYLALCQGAYASGCIVFAYVIAGPMRGAVLMILPVVVVFCAFALTPRQSFALTLFSLFLLGVTQFCLSAVDPAHFSLKLELVHFVMATSMMGAVSFLTGTLSDLRATLKAQKKELAEALTRIETLAKCDELTSLANRRHMNQILTNEERRWCMLGHSVCLALLDIDWFKQINDRYGHAAGDEVLRAFARNAQTGLRATDVLARWGGEEFLLMLPDTDLDAAVVILDRLKVQVAALRLPDIDPGLRVTFSAGLVALLPNQSIAEAVKQADHAMYRAKSRGRNCIVTV